jgi:hypothetical protein
MDRPNSERDGIRSFLFRVWYERQQGSTLWRVGVKAIPNGRWHHFTSLEEATAFLYSLKERSHDDE